jgi:Spy/CpxP family protein refolding chaperone
MRVQRSIPAALFGLALLAGSLAFLPASSGPPHRGPGWGEGGHEIFEQLADQLGMSEEQRARAREIHAAHDASTAELREQLGAAHETVAARIHAETLDEAGVREAAAALSELQAEMFVAKARLFQEVRQILTPEQLAQLEQIRSEWGGWGPHGPHGGH